MALLGQLVSAPFLAETSLGIISPNTMWSSGVLGLLGVDTYNPSYASAEQMGMGWHWGMGPVLCKALAAQLRGETLHLEAPVGWQIWRWEMYHETGWQKRHTFTWWSWRSTHFCF